MKWWSYIFPRTLTYVVGKLQEQHFNVWMFSNPGDNILIDVEILESQDIRVQIIEYTKFLTKIIKVPGYIHILGDVNVMF